MWRGGGMKLRNKKTGEAQTCDMVVITDEQIDGEIANLNRHTFIFRSVEQFNDEYEAYKPKEPLIKDEKIRKVVRAWAEANSLEHFTVINEHFNCCKIMGRKNNRVSKIEFLTTIPNTTHRTYTIVELCGEEEAPEPIEPTFIDLDGRVKEKRKNERL
jgi:hypothetical protein